MKLPLFDRNKLRHGGWSLFDVRENTLYFILFFLQQEAFPDRFIECFIAEQNLIGTGIGVACRDRAVVFVSTFACFLSRGFDQIRMGAISQTNVNFVGSHAGVSIGKINLK